MTQKSLLLIITGSVAAYKSLELIRRLREREVKVNCILTKGGEQFITALSVASLSGEPVYTNLFSLKDETEMGHIRLSRESDLILVAPASADILAKMVAGIADDLATTALLATDKPVIVAPAMNHKMWEHPATKRNVAQLEKDGIRIIQPSEGDLACGEVGSGRMAEAADILKVLDDAFGNTPATSGKPKTSSLPIRKIWNEAEQPLKGMTALVTSGPTIEPIDPVRFLSNRSSGKQGHAIAQALAEAGAKVTLVTGPVALPDPQNVNTVHVESANAMWTCCRKCMPVDIVVCAAAVADWKPANTVARSKLKKKDNQVPPALELTENIDILQTIAELPKAKRPRLVIGFAAETDEVEKHAREKLVSKHCDWIMANEVGEGKAFGADDNQVFHVTSAKSERWPRMSKQAVAERLVQAIVEEIYPNNNRIKAV